MAINEKTSAGAIAANAQVARDSGAVVQNPTANVTTTNQRLAEAGITTDDSGTNAPTVTLSQSQATPPQTNGSAAAQAGVGARSDDAVPVTGNTTKDIINATFAKNINQHIPTRPNELDDYASYTYQLSWYLLTPQQYNNLVFSPNFNVASWSLLIQSGGAPLPATSNTSTASATVGRNPFFNVDYYLDDLELFSKLPGKGTGMPHNVVDIKFKVVEPNGLTLINNLYSAVSAIHGPGPNSPELDAGNSLAQQVAAYEEANNLPASRLVPTSNYLTAHYCLGIKFHGYDSGGNLISPADGKFNTSDQNDNASMGPNNNTYSIIQKYYPFIIKDIKFRMTGRQVEYQVEAAPISQFNAFGQTRGTIPYNFELSGTTVKDLLIGKTAQSVLQPQQGGRVTQSTPPGSNISTAPAGGGGRFTGVGATGEF